MGAGLVSMQAPFGGVGGSGGVEHGHQRRQSDDDRRVRKRQPLEERTAGQTRTLSDYLRHLKTSPQADYPSPWLMIPEWT